MPLFTLWPYRSHARQSRADPHNPFMRIPVFARRSNPAVDRPILRKSLSYGETQVADLLADWVDVNDKRKGIVAREYLPRTGVVELPAAPTCTVSLAALEIPGLSFKPSTPLAPPAQELARFSARNFKNKKTRKTIAIVYVQRLPREILASNSVQL